MQGTVTARFTSQAVASLLLFAALLQQGCLYTSHHFNTGRLLEPGETAVTGGYGLQPYRTPHCGEYGWGVSPIADGSGCERLRTVADTSFRGYKDVYDTLPASYTHDIMPTFSFGYRLGVRRRWGPFTGAELGIHLEAPTNPGSAEFDLRLGLPVPRKLPLFHSISAGWITGLWADNSFFMEYAGSRPLGRGANLLFGNLRATWLATQPEDAFRNIGTTRRFAHNRRFVYQASAGFELRLPDAPLIPDFLAPELSLSFPAAPSLDGRVGPGANAPQWNFNLGMGWDFK